MLWEVVGCVRGRSCVRVNAYMCVLLPVVSVHCTDGKE